MIWGEELPPESLGKVFWKLLSSGTPIKRLETRVTATWEVVRDRVLINPENDSRSPGLRSPAAPQLGDRNVPLASTVEKFTLLASFTRATFHVKSTTFSPREVPPKVTFLSLNSLYSGEIPSEASKR